MAMGKTALGRAPTHRARSGASIGRFWKSYQPAVVPLGAAPANDVFGRMQGAHGALWGATERRPSEFLGRIDEIIRCL
jgi:hypothetical protein